MLLMVITILTIWANYESAERAVEYVVVGKAIGGDKVLSLLLMEATHFVHNLLYADPRYPRKDIHTVVLSIDSNYTDNAVTEDNVIHINSEYITGSLEDEIRGLLYRETGRLWLWDGGRKAPLGLLEGMAEYIKLVAGFNVPTPSVLMNVLDNAERVWDAGGLVTAMYLQYCEGIKSGFVADLNARMEKEWKDDLLEEILGESVTMVWSEFKKIIKNKIKLKIGTGLPVNETHFVSGTDPSLFFSVR